MERRVEFIKLHYCISNRRDTEYWVDSCDPTTIPENLKKRLSFWHRQPPTKYDFDNAWEPFNLDSYLYVLYGMNYQSDLSTISAKYTERDKAEKMFSAIDSDSRVLIEKLPKQRELVAKVLKYGFSKV